MIHGFKTTVDDEDYEYLIQFSWYKNNRGYVYNGSLGYLHRFIMSITKGLVVDHINGNKLDNRKKNLRICTQAENCSNSNKQINNTSGYKGVFKCREKWRASIMLNRKYIHIGVYNSKEEAALAYNKKAKELFGEFARLNNV